ncbi:MAG: hypothetical protein KAS15_07475 [Nanoarchaeota archaeon]|nr:hypothetical protein [Nanoarchaeota archaeon]MCK5630516.1 hypothetical protein [Nanoarchaeota archaeon]
MYKNQKFEQIGNIPDGELVVKFPGTDLKMHYEDGKAYVNKGNNIGQLALTITDFTTEDTSEEKGIIGKFGSQLSEQLNIYKKQFNSRKLLAKQNYHLFYSKAEDRTEIISMPSLIRGDNIYENHLPGMTLVTYDPMGKEISAEKVLRQHIATVGGKKLISDRQTLKKEVLELVPKVNDVYEEYFEIMKKLSSVLSQNGEYSRKSNTCSHSLFWSL